MLLLVDICCTPTARSYLSGVFATAVDMHSHSPVFHKEFLPIVVAFTSACYLGATSSCLDLLISGQENTCHQQNQANNKSLHCPLLLSETDLCLNKTHSITIIQRWLHVDLPTGIVPAQILKLKADGAAILNTD